MISEDGKLDGKLEGQNQPQLQLVKFNDTSFSASIESALEKLSKEKRGIYSRKYIEKKGRQKRGQKSARKLVKVAVTELEVTDTTASKSQSQRLQLYNRRRNHPSPIDESQCQPGPAFDSGYISLPASTRAVSEASLSLSPAFVDQGLSVYTQSTLDLEQVLQTLVTSVSQIKAAPQFETTLDHPTADQSRLISPDNNPYSTIPMDLHTACFIGQNGIVNQAVLNKEDLNKQNNSGWTPLMYAACAGRDSTILLLDGGANPNCVSAKKLSPLMVSARSGANNGYICYGLLQHGADIDARDGDGCTALLHATRHGELCVVRLLLDHGADCEIGDNDEVTPLIQAAMDGNEIIIKFLLAYGADVFHRTSQGMTAHDIALRNRHAVAGKMLRDGSFGVYDFESSSSSSDSSDGVIFARARNSLSVDNYKNTENTAMQQHHNQSEQPSLGEFLSSCGLEKLLPLFEQEEIDLPMLLTLDEKDLKEVGVRIFGPRRRLLNAIKQFTFIKTSLLMDKPDELTTTNPNVASDGDRSNKLVNHDDDPDNRPAGVEMCSQMTDVIRAINPLENVENVCREVTLTSKKKETNIPYLLFKKLGLLKKLDVSNHHITDEGTDLITMIVQKSVSLEEFDISHNNLHAARLVKISEALKTITCLHIFRMNDNDVSEEAADFITAAIGNNRFIEELNLSCNKLSSIGLLKIVNTLSMSGTIKILDISNNCNLVNNIESLATALGKCCTLQELNISHNSLMFSGVVRIAQELRDLPNLQILNLEDNTTCFSSECELLVDVILSTNQTLSSLNVCGRNIRPRFTVEHLKPPQSHEKCNHFAIQNLYLSHYLLLDGSLFLVNSPGETVSNIHSDFIEVTETCPFTSKDMMSYYVDHSGGTFYNQAHNFAFVVPPGAVALGDCVEIQATASRFGPYQLPDGVFPISSFFWISANYTFKIPVYLLFSHHASFESTNKVHEVRALEACIQSGITYTSDGKLSMKEVTDGVSFDCAIGYCVISTNHFCSYCLGKNDMRVPDEVLASFYMYNHKGILKAEICMCHVNRECIEEVKKQYSEKKAELVQAVNFSTSCNQSLTVNVDPPEIAGWIVTIQREKIRHEDFNFHKYDQPTLETLEEMCCFPPRFVVSYSRDDPTVKLHSTIILKEVNVLFPVDYDADPINGKSTSTINLPRSIQQTFGSSDVAHFSNICHVKPDLPMLSKFKTHLHQDWLYIGFSLGISQLQLNTINKGQVRSQDKCFSMLEKWLQLDSSACYCKLISAVADEQNLEVAEYIKTSVEAKMGSYSKLTTCSATHCEQVPSNSAEELSISDMRLIDDIIVPKVSASWHMVLFYLEYNIAFKKELEKKHKGDPRQCCTALFEDWITSSRGVGPKTYTKLFEVLDQVPELVSATAEIRQLLGKKGGSKTAHYSTSPDHSSTSRVSTILDQVPTVKQLLNIVYHKVAAHWDKLAYNLNFSVHEVDTIRIKCKHDPLDCCFCLLEEWLCTDHGDPKTWTVLLAAVRQTKQLHVIGIQIEDDVMKMYSQ